MALYPLLLGRTVSAGTVEFSELLSAEIGDHDVTAPWNSPMRSVKFEDKVSYTVVLYDFVVGVLGSSSINGRCAGALLDGYSVLSCPLRSNLLCTTNVSYLAYGFEPNCEVSAFASVIIA